MYEKNVSLMYKSTTNLIAKEGIGGFSNTTNYPKCSVAHWPDGKEAEQARGESEGRELVIKGWLSQ